MNGWDHCYREFMVPNSSLLEPIANHLPSLLLSYSVIFVLPDIHHWILYWKSSKQDLSSCNGFCYHWRRYFGDLTQSDFAIMLNCHGLPSFSLPLSHYKLIQSGKVLNGSQALQFSLQRWAMECHMNVHLSARLLNADWRNIFHSFSGISIYEGGIMKVYHRNYSVSGEAVFSFYVKPGFNYSMQVR